MLAGPFLRYFCSITPFQGNGDNFSDLGFAYFEGLQKTGIPIRVLATGMVDLGVKESRWDHAHECFVRPVPRRFVNVICGDYDEFSRLFTVGVPNVAIAASGGLIPPEDKIAPLHLFDVVICQTAKEAGFFRDELNVAAAHIEPTSPNFTELLRELSCLKGSE